MYVRACPSLCLSIFKPVHIKEVDLNTVHFTSNAIESIIHGKSKFYEQMPMFKASNCKSTCTVMMLSRDGRQLTVLVVVDS